MMPPRLPQLDRLFLTDGGIETTLIFHDGVDLPCNAAFPLLADGEGVARLRAYFERYIAIARRVGTGFVLESPTWRANPDWAERLGLSPVQLDALNRAAIELMHELRAAHATALTPMVVSGCVGPRGDGYRPEELMTADEAQYYHARQIGAFADAGADMIAAITMTNVAEAVGIARAAEVAGLPVAISFTVETDATLPTGETLEAAIGVVDAATASAPAYYMVNCAHPSHFAAALTSDAPWVRRIGGLRANASRLSHAELDNSPELDTGNPHELGREHRELLARLPHLAVVGGCCGTDHRHIEAIAEACLGVAA
jgi:homocysteine S-methyltransferase